MPYQKLNPNKKKGNFFNYLLIRELRRAEWALSWICVITIGVAVGIIVSDRVLKQTPVFLGEPQNSLDSKIRGLEI